MADLSVNVVQSFFAKVQYFKDKVATWEFCNYIS